MENSIKCIFSDRTLDRISKTRNSGATLCQKRFFATKRKITPAKIESILGKISCIKIMLSLAQKIKKCSYKNEN